MKLPFNLPPVLRMALLAGKLHDQGSFLDFSGPIFPKGPRHTQGPGRRTVFSYKYRSRYLPHQGKRECARRQRQIENHQLNMDIAR